MSDHGSASTYRNSGCRCDLCRAAMSAAMRRYREDHAPPAATDVPPGYAARRIRRGRVVEFVRWERSAGEGLRAHVLEAVVIDNAPDGWIVKIRHEDWAETER